jgi:hypothetical protein
MTFEIREILKLSLHKGNVDQGRPTIQRIPVYCVCGGRLTDDESQMIDASAKIVVNGST